MQTVVVVYGVAPDKLEAWPSAMAQANNTKEYFPEKYESLPLVPGWKGGNGEGGNYETFISKKPDVVIVSYYPKTSDDTAALSLVTDRQQKLDPIPVVALSDTMNLTNSPALIQFMGDLLGEQDQARDMIAFYNRVVDMVTTKVATIPEDKRVKVYYCLDKDGLSTSGRLYSDLIELCGGINVATYGNLSESGVAAGSTPKVSVEQILSWDPEVILAEDQDFCSKVLTDPAWKDITAVKNGRVYHVPKTGFSWFCCPPGINRIIGIPWTAKTLYPDLFKDMDLEGLIKEFHTLFYHKSLTDDQVQKILNS
jgi:iron complex transport system substrate-binding protein